MRSRILRCDRCGMYTLKDTCKDCGSQTVNTFPPRYSPEDRYGKYRRMYYSSERTED
ncbi:MAG: RNA-protein complex protein Nop10 [Thermoplasmatota archaeon]